MRPKFESFEELEEYLTSFWNWGDPEGEFDFVGAVAILRASLNCLRKNALEAELERFPECFDPEEAAFFSRLNGYLARAADQPADHERG